MNIASKKATRAGRWKPKQLQILAVSAAILALLGLGIGIFCVTRGTAQSEDVSASSGLVYDESAVSGGWESLTEEEIVASLNEKLEEGLINISMNTSPVFADGTSEGNLMIVNEEVNNYPQVVELFRNNTGELIYTSGAIPVGSKIERAALDVDLEAGTYECTAMFHSVDPDTGETVGSAGAVITITVQS